MDNCTDSLTQENGFYSGRIAPVILLFAFLSGLLARLYFASQIVNPGHGDPSYYLSLAKNLANGRGFVIDYIWHYFTVPDSLTHYANDFWMPLSSIIISIFQRAFGQSMLVSLFPPIIFGIATAIVTYFIGIEYSKSKIVAFWSAAICMFAPGLFLYSLITDSSIFYAVFIGVALLMIIKSSGRPNLILISAILVGLAQLARQDSILMMLTLLISIILASYDKNVKLKLISLSIILYLLIISPVYILNFIYTGAIFVSNSHKIALATSYGDLSSAAHDWSLKSFLGWGVGNIFVSRVAVIPNNIVEILKSFGRDMIFIPVAAMFALLFSKTLGFKLFKFRPVLIFAIILICFYTLIAIFPARGGALFKSTFALVPFVIVIAVTAVCRILRHKLARHIVLGIILASAIYGSVRLSINLVSLTDSLDHDIKLIQPVLESVHHGDDEIIVMTGIPAELNYTIGYRCLRIPDDDLETIYRLAERYKANYMILPAPGYVAEKLFNGEVKDRRFELIDHVKGTDFRIYKISL